MERKLAAILSADVQGYSRLMGDDEVATIRTLTAYREVISALIQKRRGRVVDSPGDNLLAEFASAVDAVEGAVEIQRELGTRNAEIPSSRRMEFRIGINVGDVLVEEERIYGDGVNIAARLESLAAGGGICISGTVYDQVQNKLSLGFSYKGVQTVKNIEGPIRVYAVGPETPESRSIQSDQAGEASAPRSSDVVADHIRSHDSPPKAGVEPQTQLEADLAPDFQIIRFLEEASVAHVYLAREKGLQRLVAIKVMKAELARDETARKRFEREAQSAGKIRHQNVAAVHRVGSLADETPFIVVEHIEGRNLADALQAEGAMEVEKACDVLSQVATALAAAHEKGIVHRDVKPANVVCERDSNRVVLTDFGIAGILETGTEKSMRITKTGEILERDPHYVSPEQLLGESITGESDVYNLGILGYELLTLTSPYEAKSALNMITAHLTWEPIPLEDLRSDVDPQLGGLLARCLAKNPKHRPRASEVARALSYGSGVAPTGGAPAGVAPTGAAPEPAARAIGLPLGIITAVLGAVALVAYLAFRLSLGS